MISRIFNLFARTKENLCKLYCNAYFRQHCTYAVTASPSEGRVPFFLSKISYLIPTVRRNRMSLTDAMIGKINSFPTGNPRRTSVVRAFEDKTPYLFPGRMTTFNSSKDNFRNF
jgi:hypothetical protein